MVHTRDEPFRMTEATLKVVKTLFRPNVVLRGCRGGGDRRELRDEPTAIEGVLAVLATTSQSGAD